MDKVLIRESKRIYNFIVNFYPKNYKHEFGEEMKYVFSESLNEAYNKNGDQGIVCLWIRTTFDYLKSILREYLEKEKGGGKMSIKSKDIIMQNKIFGYIALFTALILSIPLVAMQFTSEVDWELGDFMIMGTLLFGTGFTFVHIARVTPKKYRVLFGIVFLAALLLTWIHLAVGIVDSWPLAGS